MPKIPSINLLDYAMTKAAIAHLYKGLSKQTIKRGHLRQHGRANYVPISLWTTARSGSNKTDFMASC
jgi:hypothetical protein